MYFSDSLTLRAVKVTHDSFGDSVKSYTDTTVFADKRAVTRSEFYTANMAGIKIDLVFAVHVEDFSNQTVAIYDSKQYEVVRAYQKGEGIVELSLREVA